MRVLGWSGEGVGVRHEASSSAFVEFGEHPIGESLKRPADAVLTGKRQCQPGGKQGAENERGGHGEGISMGKGREAAGTGEGRRRAGAQPPDGDFCAQSICRVFARNLATRWSLVSPGDAAKAKVHHQNAVAQLRRGSSGQPGRLD